MTIRRGLRVDTVPVGDRTVGFDGAIDGGQSCWKPSVHKPYLVTFKEAPPADVVAGRSFTYSIIIQHPDLARPQDLSVVTSLIRIDPNREIGTEAWSQLENGSETGTTKSKRLEITRLGKYYLKVDLCVAVSGMAFVVHRIDSGVISVIDRYEELWGKLSVKLNPDILMKNGLLILALFLNHQDAKEILKRSQENVWQPLILERAAFLKELQVQREQGRRLVNHTIDEYIHQTFALMNLICGGGSADYFMDNFSTEENQSLIRIAFDSAAGSIPICMVFPGTLTPPSTPPVTPPHEDSSSESTIFDTSEAATELDCRPPLPPRPKLTLD